MLRCSFTRWEARSFTEQIRRLSESGLLRSEVGRFGCPSITSVSGSHSIRRTPRQRALFRVSRRRSWQYAMRNELANKRMERAGMKDHPERDGGRAGRSFAIR